MSTHRPLPELPTLTLLADETTTLANARFSETLEVNPMRVVAVEPLEPRPMALCVFDRLGKPLEAQYLDLASGLDQAAGNEIIKDAYCDELSVIVWPRNGASPLLPAIDLLRRMIARHTTGQLPDNPFVRAWVKEAGVLLADFKDIDELLAFVEPDPEKSPEEDDLHDG